MAANNYLSTVHHLVRCSLCQLFTLLSIYLTINSLVWCYISYGAFVSGLDGACLELGNLAPLQIILIAIPITKSFSTEKLIAAACIPDLIRHPISWSSLSTSRPRLTRFSAPHRLPSLASVKPWFFRVLLSPRPLDWANRALILHHS